MLIFAIASWFSQSESGDRCSLCHLGLFLMYVLGAQRSYYRRYLSNVSSHSIVELRGNLSHHSTPCQNYFRIENHFMSIPCNKPCPLDAWIILEFEIVLSQCLSLSLSQNQSLSESLSTSFKSFKVHLHISQYVSHKISLGSLSVSSLSDSQSVYSCLGPLSLSTLLHHCSEVPWRY